MAKSANNHLFDYVDMFPLTNGGSDIQTNVSSHVETVVLLCRKLEEAERHISVTIETEEGWRADRQAKETFSK